MAGGKESARQKMINLMYLVFIAMLALNMSKEVLMTFGEIEREVSKTSMSLQAENSNAISIMESQAKNSPDEWNAAYETVKPIADAANELITFINNDENEFIVEPYKVNGIEYRKLKRPILEKENDFKRTIDGKIPEMVGDYEVMDNSAAYDEMLFTGDYKGPDNPGYTELGKEFVRLVNNFRDTAINALEGSKISNDSIKNAIWENSVPGLINSIESSFNTDLVKVGKGDSKVKSWLHFNYDGFPEIASITKLTLLEEDAQNVVKSLISNVNETILGENLSSLKAIPVNVNNFYENEKLSGAISLGKFDPTFKANQIQISIDGAPPIRKDADEVMENGQIMLEKFGINVGSAGEKEITGDIIFLRRGEDGENVERFIKIDHKYFVNKPLANISNPSMNVVYRGYPNILNISMPGVSDANIEIIAPKSLRRNPKVANQYILENENGKNGKVDIIVKDKLNNITASPVTFSVVKLPPANAYVVKKGLNKIKRSALAAATIKAVYNDERLENAIKPKVTSFKLRIGSNIAGTSRSNKFTNSQRDKIKKAKKGTTVLIYDIKYIGNNLIGNPETESSLALTLQ
tara:strand:- start:227 stop:1966 length:1740 start_codon:yes stop_codon:yes gene_type:complete